MLGGGLEFRYSVVGEGEMGNGEFVLKCVCVGGGWGVGVGEVGRGGRGAGWWGRWGGWGGEGGDETFNLRGHHVVNRSS